MGHIFISYSHKDTAYVEKLEAKLISEGFDVWVDHRIDYGTQWPKEIQKALDTCDAFIVVVSENSYESEWVQSEVARAKRIKKPFFPLLFQGEVWLGIEARHYVDVLDGSLPPEKFYSKLKDALADTAAKQAEILLLDAMKAWSDFQIFPRPDLLFVLWKDLDYKTLSIKRKVFLYCMYYILLDDIELWVRHNDYFSFDSFLESFVEQENNSFSLLQKFSISSYETHRLRIRAAGKAKTVAIAKVRVSLDAVEVPAFHLFCSAGKKDDIELHVEILLLPAKNEVDVFISYTEEPWENLMPKLWKIVHDINHNGCYADKEALREEIIKDLKEKK